MSNQTGSNTNKFKTKWGFILACVGSAVGMANVWGFPYKLGTNGGAAFLIIYLFFIALFGFVGLSAEYAIGRRSGTGTVGSYEFAWNNSKFGDSKVMKNIGKVIGWLPLCGSMCIAIGYAVIIAYVFKAFTNSMTGAILGVNPEEWFAGFAFKNFSVVPYHIIVIIGALITITFGASTIEKTNKIMMPLFFILFLVLAIRILLLPGALDGYKFLLVPDLSILKDPKVWVSAMGQAFFSLSITGSGMIVYGAYLSRNEDVVGGAKQTAIFDTLAAMVAAIVMIPACYAYAMKPDAGPGLLFVVLPTILQKMPGGRLFGIILYCAVLFGGISSIQNMYEVVAESIMYKFKKLPRKAVIVLLGVICFSVGVFMEPIAETKGAILGGWGAWMDLVSIYIIPIGAVLGGISWFWILRKEDLLEEINAGAKIKRGNVWFNIGRYLYVPLTLILCIYALAFRVAF